MSVMESWQDEDFEWESADQQNMWEQRPQQAGKLQPLRNASPQRSNRMQRAFNTRAASDEESYRMKLPPRQHYNYLHTYSGRTDHYPDCSVLGSDDYNSAAKSRNFYAALNRSTLPRDYVKLNRTQLKGYNNRKFIYPQKTYTGMFSKKKPASVGCTDRHYDNGKWFIVFFLWL